MAAIFWLACGLAFIFHFGATVLDNDAEIGLLGSSSAIFLFFGATVGTVFCGRKGAFIGVLVGGIVGFMIPVVVALLYIAYMIAIGEDWFPGVAD
ncbi:hypothetical protein [Crateriforma conspicua]|uniref:hypothetical protein n=1 Tax=Crateriforma conspicua TaxID=2527996 RepID=UPI0018CE2FB8|nr:hypothetical protein [Crateriforma conspicua]